MKLHASPFQCKRIQAIDVDLHTVVELYNTVIDLIGTCRGGFDSSRSKRPERSELLSTVKPYVENDPERNILTKHHQPRSTFHHVRTSELAHSSPYWNNWMSTSVSDT